MTNLSKNLDSPTESSEVSPTPVNHADPAPLAPALKIPAKPSTTHSRLGKTITETVMEMKALQIKMLIELYLNHHVPEGYEGTDDLGELFRLTEALAPDFDLSFEEANKLVQLGFNSGIKCAASIASSAGSMEKVLA